MTGWEEQARRDRRTAQKNEKIEEYGAAAFYYQQAVEKILKHVLSIQDKSIPQTHDCFRLAQDAETPDNVRDAADNLSPYYMRTRYPDTGVVDLDEHDINRIASATDTVFQWIDEKHSNK